MCRPIRTLTEAKGYDASLHNLASFGGAGGQHACDISKALGVSRVLIHKHSSVLSAYGMALADVVHEERSPSALVFAPENFSAFGDELSKLEAKSVEALLQQRIPKTRISSERYLNMRFHGSDTPLMVQETQGLESFITSFKEAHKKQFGFLPAGRDVIVDDYRVRSIGHSVLDLPTAWPIELAGFKESPYPKAEITKDVYFKGLGWCKTPVHDLNRLAPSSKVAGPALIMDDKQTILVIPQATATILSNLVIIDVNTVKKSSVNSRIVDPIQLSIFGHRFMGVAEQMGRALQKTSVSTNIKERLDFSCTVFSPDGGLVANAPHVPAMVSN
jgi:5-oxoprolinase (ATP-hydrolysing)